MRSTVMAVLVAGSLAIGLGAGTFAQEPLPAQELDESGSEPWPSTTLKGAQAITAGHDRFVAVGEGGKRKPFAKVWVSTDGLSWTRAPASPALKSVGMHAVIATDDGFVALGTDVDNRVTAWHSPDGLAWQRGKVKRPGKKGLDAWVQDLLAKISATVVLVATLDAPGPGRRLRPRGSQRRHGGAVRMEPASLLFSPARPTVRRVR